MLLIGTKVRSRRSEKLVGEIVGYGALQWPSGANMSGDGGIMQLVYLVQVADGSSSLGPACLVFRADFVEVMP